MESTNIEHTCTTDKYHGQNIKQCCFIGSLMFMLTELAQFIDALMFALADSVTTLTFPSIH